MANNFDNELLGIVKDLENTRQIYHGYAYPRTIRNILVGKQNAVIAPFFTKKRYYGLFARLSLDAVSQAMDKLVSLNKITCIYTDRGKLYCTWDYLTEYNMFH